MGRVASPPPAFLVPASAAAEELGCRRAAARCPVHQHHLGAIRVAGVSPRKGERGPRASENHRAPGHLAAPALALITVEVWALLKVWRPFHSLDRV